MRRLLARAALGATLGGVWGWLCNNYLGWVGVVLTGALGLGLSLWALRSLRELREQEREFQRILSSVRRS
jgi:Flp pilus assembly protein TadB